jgi:thiol-disulfide isomerase/thioredoxin
MCNPLDTLKDFDEFVADDTKYSIIDFTATWCPPCKAIKPKFVKFARENKSDKVKFATVDVDRNNGAPKKGDVANLPTFQVWKGGAKIEGFCGCAEGKLIALIEKYSK